MRSGAQVRECYGELQPLITPGGFDIHIGFGHVSAFGPSMQTHLQLRHKAHRSTRCACVGGSGGSEAILNKAVRCMRFVSPYSVCKSLKTKNSSKLACTHCKCIAQSCTCTLSGRVVRRLLLDML